MSMVLPREQTNAAPAISRRAMLALDRQHGAEVTPETDADFWLRVHRRAMACRFEITLSGEDSGFLEAARDALTEVDRVEDRLTVFRETSDLVDLNRRAARESVALDAEMMSVLSTCRRLSVETEGAFDPTSTPLSRCWGFLKREGRLPLQTEIEAARACVGINNVSFDANAATVRFQHDGTELNLGGIGKGYALDRVAALLVESGVEHALISAGGSSLRAVGGRGGGFRVDLCSPARKAPLVRLRLHDASLGTSGASLQFVEIEGHRYGHVIDPRTGWPASGVLSASVVADDAASADALSTAFLVGGEELARRYCETHANVAVFLTPDTPQGRTLLVGHHPGMRVEASTQ
jgi:thiamine biosynthesis lipoprotein